MRTKAQDFRDLVVWQGATELALACEAVCVALPPSAAMLAAQIRRAALSVPANIAEGNWRFSRADYLRHLSIANGSLKELQSHLWFAAKAYGMNQHIRRAFQLAELVGRLLTALVKSLRRKA